MARTNTAAESYIVERQLAAARQKRGDRSLVDGERDEAVRKLCALEALEGGLRHRAPRVRYDGGR